VFFHRTFKQLDSEASESIPIGDHNAFDNVALDEVQKGEKPASGSEGESGADVLEDAIVFRSASLQELNLALEVTRLLLLRGGDSGIEDDLSLSALRFLFRPEAEEGVEVSEVVSMRRAIGGRGFDAEVAELSFFGPLREGGPGDPEFRNRRPWSDKNFVVHDGALSISLVTLTLR